MLALRREALALLALLATGLAGTVATAGQPAGDTFARQVERLSEAGGAFDTDNLISNETSYLQVVPDLVALGARGGAYIGVGPDQNFSYITRIRPTVAYIVDIRRDNLLLHMLFKALFDLAPTRAEYLSLLTARPPPTPERQWLDASIDRIADYLDATAADPNLFPTLRLRIERVIASTGTRVSDAELATIARFHQAFVKDGLGLRFNTLGRRPQYYYPTLRDLLLARGAEGRQWSYLASDVDYQFIRSLERRDLVIPVTGDLAGAHALGAIADDIAARHEHLSAFYVSNVENYLFRDGRFERFLDNLERLPRTDRSVVIRSVFGGGPSTSIVQPVRDMLTDHRAGRYRSYNDLVRATWRKAGVER